MTLLPDTLPTLPKGSEATWEVWKKLVAVALDIPMRYYGQKLSVQTKSDSSPVTDADRYTEEALREEIMKFDSSHAIIGEEFGEAESNSDYQWVIDPIDGTKSFICGYPMFGCLVGLLHRGVPIVGMAVLPALKKVFFGAGEGAWCNGQAITVSAVSELSKARLSLGEANEFCTHYPQAAEILSAEVSMLRFYHDCYSFCLLAEGGLHGVIESGLQAYDILPLVPLVTGAGGCIGDWQGEAITLANWNPDGKIIAAANDTLQKQIVTLVNANFN